MEEACYNKYFYLGIKYKNPGAEQILFAQCSVAKSVKFCSIIDVEVIGARGCIFIAISLTIRTETDARHA